VASLDFQPEFTATASNVGYGWWSHDVGGHIHGVRDDELATRWVQLGLFSPILRLHSTNNPFLVKEPWLYPLEARAAMGDALRFRHRLVPYLHTMNHRASAEGIPLVRPMYYLAPEEDRAYDVPNQFAFGSELLVAPITTRRDTVTLRGSVRAGSRPAPGSTSSPRRSTRRPRDRAAPRARLDPALLRAGGILPLAAADDLDATRNPERLEVVVAARRGRRVHAGRGRRDQRRAHHPQLGPGGRASSPSPPPTTRTACCRPSASGRDGARPEHEPLAVRGPTGEALRVEAGADPRRARRTARTRCSRSSTPRSTPTRPSRRRGGR
jgi:hypothetical protein